MAVNPQEVWPINSSPLLLLKNNSYFITRYVRYLKGERCAIHDTWQNISIEK
jgi:hypothetical protein